MNRRNFMHYVGGGSLTSMAAGMGVRGLLGYPAAASAEPAPVPQPGKIVYRRTSLAEYEKHVYGAWLGKIVGAVFGWPFEGQAENVVSGLDHYLHSYTYAPVDDDYYYEMVAMYGFEKHGVQMTVEQLGEMWLEYRAGTWGSSQQTRFALEKGIKPPQTGEPRYNKWFHTIGPQFSSGLYGMLTGGMVNLAGKLARYYTHINGYAESCDGAVFVASCTSEAFFEKDPERIVRQAARLISPQSNYRQALDQVLEGYASREDWRALASRIEARWRPDYPQLNNSVANGALCALALLYGQGDWLKSVNIITSVDDFTDADCNADVVGSVLANIHGAQVIPSGIVTTLNDRIYGTSMGPLQLNRVIDERITDFAKRIAAMGRKILLAHGAREEAGDLLIPRQEAEEQPVEWFDINDYGKLWNPAWRLFHASRGSAGVTYLEWETNTLVTFPRDTRPCRLEREVDVPVGHAELALNVAAVPGKPWLLQVFVNDDPLLKQVMTIEASGSEVQYQDLHVDLSKYGGQSVKLRLYHWLVQGKAPGSAYWKTVEVRAV
ncbi:MAG: ADP-ribosylglycohydrolase family protein [Terriglobia bacterium]